MRRFSLATLVFTITLIGFGLGMYRIAAGRPGAEHLISFAFLAALIAVVVFGGLRWKPKAKP
jgi:hypothetical protein